MITADARIAVAALLAGASIMAGDIGRAGERIHTSLEGNAPCIHFEGITQEPKSGYYYATWKNDCTFNIRIHYSRVIPETGKLFEDTRWVMGTDAKPPLTNVAEVLLMTSSRLEDWYEVF